MPKHNQFIKKIKSQFVSINNTIESYFNNLKFLIKNLKKTKLSQNNKVFLISIERIKVETDETDKKINSICRFDFVDKVKSKNIDQSKTEDILELIGIDYLKNKDDFEINLIFSNNSHIVLTAEAIEVRLEDQNEIK